MSQWRSILSWDVTKLQKNSIPRIGDRILILSIEPMQHDDIVEIRAAQKAYVGKVVVVSGISTSGSHPIIQFDKDLTGVPDYLANKLQDFYRLYSETDRWEIKE